MRQAYVILALLLAFPVLLAPVTPAPAQANAPLYAPSIASPNSTLVGTTGPNGSVTLDFSETHNRTEHRTIKADAAGRFVLRAPANALGVDFSILGAVRHCIISADRKLIVDGLAARHAVSGTLAIVAAQTGYDIHQPVLLQVEHFNPLSGKVLLDDGPIQLLAGSDRSVVAALSETVSLGRHGIGIASNGHAIEIQADVVKTSLSVTGPDDYRIPRKVTLYVDGLYGDRAKVNFGVTGGAVFANNKDEITVPVVPPGEATTTVKADKPGEVGLKWKLDIGVGLKYNYGNYGNYETPQPYETTPPINVAPPPLIPCTIRLTDGWFEAVQGPYQDDPIFTQKPERLVREDGDTISYYGPTRHDQEPAVGVNGRAGVFQRRATGEGRQPQQHRDERRDELFGIRGREDSLHAARTGRRPARDLHEPDCGIRFLQRTRRGEVHSVDCQGSNV